MLWHRKIVCGDCAIILVEKLQVNYIEGKRLMNDVVNCLVIAYNMELQYNLWA